MGPDQDLVEFYGTKTAAIPTVLQLLAARTAVRGVTGGLNRLREQAELMNEQARMIEMMRMQAATGGFKGTHAPAFISPGGVGPYGYSVPVGMDSGMVRLASEEAGRKLAAGIGAKIRKKALTGLTIGGAALGLGGLAAGKAIDVAKENILEDPDDGRLVPLHKLGNVGAAAKNVAGGVGDLISRAAQWGKKGLSKTTLRGTLAGGALAAGALGTGYAGKKAIDLLSTEVKPYSYATGGFRPPTTPSPYGYVVPAAPRY